MNPILLDHDQLALGHFTSLALDAAGRRIYLGRVSSRDPQRQNLAELTIDPANGAVTTKQTHRDSNEPLPPAFTPQTSSQRPESHVRALLLAPRYRKLYLAACLDIEASSMRPARY